MSGTPEIIAECQACGRGFITFNRKDPIDMYGLKGTNQICYGRIELIKETP